MAKKRKSDATRLDEVDRTMHTTFCGAANSLSQLYTQAMNHQRLSFQAGERHSMEKLYQWILRQQEEGSRVPTVDIIAYLQNELDCGPEEPPMSPKLPFQQHSDQQAKNSVFSNALSSPVRRSLQHYHSSAGNGPRSNDTNCLHGHNRYTNSPSSTDSPMDMRSDSP